jgi:acetyl esterase/lipase
MSILSMPVVADTLALAFAATVNPAQKSAVRFADIPRRTSHVTIPTRYGPVSAVLYQPPSDVESPPVYVNVHGGGFVVGHPEQDGPPTRAGTGMAPGCALAGRARTVMKPWMGEVFDTAYIPDRAQRRHRLASPAWGPNADGIVGIGPAVVVTAGHDRLRDEARTYAEMLDAARSLVHAPRDTPWPGQRNGVSMMASNTASRSSARWSALRAWSARVPTTRRMRSTPLITDSTASLRTC